MSNPRSKVWRRSILHKNGPTKNTTSFQLGYDMVFEHGEIIIRIHGSIKEIGRYSKFTGKRFHHFAS